MIPLLHIITFLDALFCLLAIKKLNFSYQKSRDVDVGDFLKAYIALGIYFALVSLPAILSDPAKVQVVYILSYIPVILSGLFLLRVAFHVLKWPLWSASISFFVYGSIIISTVLNTIFFSPAFIRPANDIFYHWAEGTPDWLETFNGVLIGFLATGCSFLFFLGGRKSKERLVQVRSFRIGGGLFLLVVAALLNYVEFNYAGFLFPGEMVRWLVSVLASFVALGGLILMLAGIYYHHQEDKVSGLTQ